MTRQLTSITSWRRRIRSAKWQWLICQGRYCPIFTPAVIANPIVCTGWRVKEFGHLWQGYSRVQAIRDWVLNRVTFRSNSSTSDTTAVDTLVEEVGVCRDFAT